MADINLRRLILRERNALGAIALQGVGSYGDVNMHDFMKAQKHLTKTGVLIKLTLQGSLQS